MTVPVLSRRDALRAAGVGLAAVPLAKLVVGCGDDDAGRARDASTGGDTGTSPADAAMGADGSTAGDAGTQTDGGAVTGWATGGTAAMTARDSYPDPFAAAGTLCVVQCAATLGPCHTTSPERADVSDGLDGLPVRLALRVVDESCNPVANAIVEIWHTNASGIYSGNIAMICNTAEEDRAAGYMRGYLRTDVDGRVDFDTVFPGWYRGRAVHIHYRIQTGDYMAADDAPAEVISQLFFSDALEAEIFAGEPLYRDFGQPDTTNGTDNILRGTSDITPYVLDTARMTDGAMQASKTIMLRSTCRVGM